MAERYFPFNSVGGDRRYKAEDFAGYFASIISSGVLADGENLSVTAAGGLKIAISPGYAWVKGQLYRNETTKTLTLEPGGSLPRIVRVVTRAMTAERKIESIFSEGTPAATPEPPELVRNADYYDICLAEITVPASAIEITDSNIKDTRTDNEVCGVIRTLIETLDVGAFMKNCRDEFNRWFANLQYVLDGDVAGHLQTEIDNIVRDFKRSPASVVSSGTASALTATVPDFDYAARNGIDLELHTNVASGATLDVNGLGAKPIVSNDGSAISDGPIAGSTLLLRYNASQEKWYIGGGGGAGVKFFGDGSDGDFHPTANYQFTLPNGELDLHPIIRQYKSINIPAGVTVSVGTPDVGHNSGAGRNKGLILYCQGDCIIDGTINQNLKAPIPDPNNKFFPIFPTRIASDKTATDPAVFLGNPKYCDLFAEVKGGDGGGLNNVGTVTGALMAGTYKIGISGSPGTIFGGGFGAGGYGRSGQIISGGTYEDMPLGTVFPTAQTTTMAAAPGAGGFSGRSPNAIGGRGPGGCGAYEYAPFVGGDGNAYGGGLIAIICGGDLIINGVLTANGGEGGIPSESNSTSDHCAGCGGGGGIIILVYKGAYTLAGSLRVNGGVPGSSATTPSAGALGSIKVAQFV